MYIYISALFESQREERKEYYLAICWLFATYFTRCRIQTRSCVAQCLNKPHITELSTNNSLITPMAVINSSLFFVYDTAGIDNYTRAYCRIAAFNFIVYMGTFLQIHTHLYCCLVILKSVLHIAFRSFLVVIVVVIVVSIPPALHSDLFPAKNSQ